MNKILLAILVLLTPLARATTRYVTTTGSNSNPCTLAQPCATPDYAANVVAVPGDTVLVASGTYDYGTSNPSFTNGGTAGNYITITCATRGSCTITGHTPAANNALMAIQADYIVFDGFEVKNNTNTLNNIGIYFDHNFIKLTRNTIHHINIDCSNAGGGGISSAHGVHDILMDSNLIYDIGWPDGGSPACDSSVVQFDGIILETDGVNQVYTNNIIYHVAGGWGLGPGGNTATTTPLVIANNLLFSNANGGLVIAGTNGWSGDGSTITNNIIVDNGLVRSGCGVNLIYAGTMSSALLENNDVFGNAGGDYCFGSTTPIQSGNISVNPALGTTFVNWQANGSGDYHEKTGSPTIHAGTGSSPTNDYDGRTRVVPLDIGPYQAPNTWYIRPDGGTATRCTGHVNAPDPGSGTNQPCALNHPFWLMAPGLSVAWRSDYVGGDIVLHDQGTGPNTYYMGQLSNGHGQNWNANGIATNKCVGNTTPNFDCNLPVMQSGTAYYPTKWYGASTGSCHTNIAGSPTKFNLNNPTVYVAIAANFYQFKLQGSNYVDIECIQMRSDTTCSQSGVQTSIVGTSKSGTVATYQWRSGGQVIIPLPTQKINVSGTTNGGGVFNGNNLQIASETTTSLNITNSQMTSGTATFTYNVAQGISPSNGERVQITGTTNCGGAFNGIFQLPISNVTGTTFQVTGLSGSCGSQAESGTALDPSSGTFTVGGFSSGTVSLASESGNEQPYGFCGNATTGIDFGGNGIIMEYQQNRGPSNVTLKDLSVEGFMTGVLGSGINTTTSDTSTFSYIKVLGNSNAGWNGDGGGCGTGCENIGTINMDHIMMDFNGMAEVIPNGGYSSTTGLPVNGFNYGYAQQTGGYGDGFALIASNQMTFNFTSNEASYNTQDGFDLLHLGDDPTFPQTLNIQSNQAEGNMGQTFKLGGAKATVNGYNNFGRNNCRTMQIGTAPYISTFPSGWNAGLQDSGDNCRAGGDNVVLFTADGITTTWIHNTIVGYGQVMYDVQCAGSCTGSNKMIFRDNIQMAFPNPSNGVFSSGIVLVGVSNPFANSGSQIDHNQWFQMANGCPQITPQETNTLCSDPQFVSESNIDTLNPLLTTSSPSYHSGVVAGLATDFFGHNFSTPNPSRGFAEILGGINAVKVKLSGVLVSQ